MCVWRVSTTDIKSREARTFVFVVLGRDAFVCPLRGMYGCTWCALPYVHRLKTYNKLCCKHTLPYNYAHVTINNSTCGKSLAVCILNGTTPHVHGWLTTPHVHGCLTTPHVHGWLTTPHVPGQAPWLANIPGYLADMGPMPTPCPHACVSTPLITSLYLVWQQLLELSPHKDSYPQYRSSPHSKEFQPTQLPPPQLHQL